MGKAFLQLTNFTLGPDATLNTETHKDSVRIKALNSVNSSKRKHKNQINHFNKQITSNNMTHWLLTKFKVFTISRIWGTSFNIKIRN